MRANTPYVLIQSEWWCHGRLSGLVRVLGRVWAGPDHLVFINTNKHFVA